MIDRENTEPMRDEEQFGIRVDFPEVETSSIGSMNCGGAWRQGGRRRVRAHGLQGDKGDGLSAGRRGLGRGAASFGIVTGEVGV